MPSRGLIASDVSLNPRSAKLMPSHSHLVTHRDDPPLRQALCAHPHLIHSWMDLLYSDVSAFEGHQRAAASESTPRPSRPPLPSRRISSSPKPANQLIIPSGGSAN